MILHCRLERGRTKGRMNEWRKGCRLFLYVMVLLNGERIGSVYPPFPQPTQPERFDGHYFCFLFAYSCLGMSAIMFYVIVECKSSNKFQDYCIHHPRIMNYCDPQR
jgi:hypothetical protein